MPLVPEKHLSQAAARPTGGFYLFWNLILMLIASGCSNLVEVHVADSHGNPMEQAVIGGVGTEEWSFPFWRYDVLATLAATDKNGNATIDVKEAYLDTYYVIKSGYRPMPLVSTSADRNTKAPKNINLVLRKYEEPVPKEIAERDWYYRDLFEGIERVSRAKTKAQSGDEGNRILWEKYLQEFEKEKVAPYYMRNWR